MNMTDIRDITDFTILRLNQNGQSITPLKLQKLLYYIQAWHLVYFDNQMFCDIPEAWVNGPVYRSVYDRFKNVGIYTQITARTIRTKEADISIRINELRQKMGLTKEEYKFLEAIYLHYGTKSQDELVLLTHSEFPWNHAREGLEPLDYADNKISIEDMKNYYGERLKR